MGGGEGGDAYQPAHCCLLQVEAEEAKHGTAGPLVSEEAFPSLGESSKQPGGKQSKKGKGAKLSLSQFGAFQVGRRAQLSDKEILLQLPKGSSGLPKEERDGALGGGFKDYGGNRQQGELGDGGSFHAEAVACLHALLQGHVGLVAATDLETCLAGPAAGPCWRVTALLLVQLHNCCQARDRSCMC